MWLAIVCSYCVLCWLGVTLLLSFCAEQVAKENVNGINPRFFEFFIVLISPLIVPCAFVAILPCLVKGTLRSWQILRVYKKYREYEFVPVNSLWLDEPIRRQFDTHTPSLIQLGFEFIGDYRLKPKPIEVHDRLFLNHDGEIMAAICAVLESGGISLISILEDGTCVHTTSVENPHPERIVEPADQLSISYVPDTSIQHLYQHHVHMVREVSTRNGTTVMRLRRDQFREVVIYDQRIFCRFRFRNDDLDQEPPAPDLGSLHSDQPAAPQGRDHAFAKN
jgi:hypothetical protein